jgi:hypothetical protein
MAKIPTYAEVSIPDALDLLPLVDVSDTTDDATGSSRRVTLARLLGALLPMTTEGRLTTETAVPVSTADRTAQATLFWTPIGHGLLKTWDGTRWRARRFGELSKSLTGLLTNGKNHDIYVKDSDQSLQIGAAWTNDSTRSAALAQQDGVDVLGSDHTLVRVGTIRATGTGTTEDSALNRFVHNAYNKAPRSLDTAPVIDSHTYNTAAYREWHGGTNSVRLSFIVGDLEKPCARGDLSAEILATGVAAYGAIGFNSTTVPAGFGFGIVPTTVGVQARLAYSAPMRVTTLGFNQLIAIQYGNATTAPTFVGYQMTGEVWA